MFETLAALTPLLAAVAVLCVVVGLRAWAERAAMGARLDALVAPVVGTVPVQSGFDEPSFTSRAVMPLVQMLARFAESLLPDRQIERIRTNLAIAGMPYSRHLAQFLAAQLAIASSVGLLVGLYVWQGADSLLRAVLMALVGAAIGFYLPVVWLGRRMAQRRTQILRALPDALDLLSISVSAGLGFDGAMLEVVQRWDNPLTREFAAVLRDMKLGTSRRDALRAFARRTGVEEVGAFVAAVLQADELGAPMKEVLLIQAEQMRLQRRHKAEERARKATVKMLIPMVFFIFPAMFIVLLGPAIPSLKALGGIF